DQKERCAAPAGPEDLHPVVGARTRVTELAAYRRGGAHRPASCPGTSLRQRPSGNHPSGNPHAADPVPPASVSSWRCATARSPAPAPVARLRLGRYVPPWPPPVRKHDRATCPKKRRDAATARPRRPPGRARPETTLH